jgi:hypothetical protein
MAWPCTICSHHNIDDTDSYCEACGAARGALAPAPLPSPGSALPASPLPDGTGYAFRVLRGLAAGQALPIPDQPVLTLGRAPDDDVVLPDPTISRHHLRLHRCPTGELLAEDYGASGTGSANGTLIAGMPAPVGQPTPLTEGERIQLGRSVELEVIRA